MPEKLTDTFSDDRRPGQVIASTAGGARRLGVDAESRFSIDHDALRLAQIREPGWGRHALVYDPIEPRPGSGILVTILNGHNTSQAGRLGQSLARRIARWTVGARAQGLGARAIAYPMSLKRESLPAKIARWRPIAGSGDPRVRMDDNLAVGLFPEASPTDPTRTGHAFVMHAADTTNGELRAIVAGEPIPVLESVQNIPLMLGVVVLEDGVAYLAASLPGARGLPGAPELRVLAVDPNPPTSPVHPAIHQCVLGQIGFSIDTRLFEVRTGELNLTPAPRRCDDAPIGSTVRALDPVDPRLNLPKPCDHLILADDFSNASDDLRGRRTPTGAAAWARTLGRGLIEGASGTDDAPPAARVRASRDKPNPGRTIYSLDWPSRGPADLRVEMTPPGTERGQGENGRSGLVFWQDRHNYLVINLWLDDGYRGASVSSFLTLHGFEDIYDAVWTNVGDRVTWGRPFALRAHFDGDRYLVWLNDEPVLERALADVYPRAHPLRIERVGLVANWEWGNDTGTRFRSFEARAPGQPLEPGASATG